MQLGIGDQRWASCLGAPRPLQYEEWEAGPPSRAATHMDKTCPDDHFNNASMLRKGGREGKKALDWTRGVGGGEALGKATSHPQLEGFYH